MRREIARDGGEATVAEANLIAGMSDAEIEGRFREAKDSDYAELFREAAQPRRAASAAVRSHLGDACRCARAPHRECLVDPTAGLSALIARLALLHRDDDARIARGAELVELL